MWLLPQEASGSPPAVIVASAACAVRLIMFPSPGRKACHEVEANSLLLRIRAALSSAPVSSLDLDFELPALRHRASVAST